MKIATWNVNSIAVRLPRLLAFLAREAPDVVCLQELKCTEDRFPATELTAAGYHSVLVGQKAYNGVALLSRQPFVEVTRGFGDGVDDQAARFISARVGGITLMSAYVPNGQEVGGEKYFYKLNWLARLRRYLDKTHRAEAPLILAGDFNVAPTDRDVYDPGAWRDKLLCSGREREALSNAVAFGLFDAYRHLHPKETQYTWWDYRLLAFAKDHGLRIDLMYVTAPLVGRLRSSWVARDERAGDKPSDHAPVLVDLGGTLDLA